jgi:hypothetical protein
MEQMMALLSPIEGGVLERHPLLIANSLQTGSRHKLVTVTGAISGLNSY